MKKGNNENIEKIRSRYVCDNFAQAVFKYRGDSITIFGPYGIQYHYKKGSDNLINWYKQDKRSKQFPYHNIPLYIKFVTNGCVKVVNQILEFDRNYIKVTDGYVSECCIVKDKDNALFFTRNVSLEKEKSLILNTHEVNEILSNNNTNFYSLYGGIYNNLSLPNEEEILSEIKDQIKNLRGKETHDEERGFLSSTISQYIDKSVDLLTIDDICSIGLCDNILFPEGLLEVSYLENAYNIKLYKIQIIGHDKYSIKTYKGQIKNSVLDNDSSKNSNDYIVFPNAKMTTFSKLDLEEEQANTKARVLSK